MRVLVTGASGFIGRAVVAHLAGCGWEVVGLSRRRVAMAGLAEYAEGDLSQATAEQLAELVAPCNAIVHAAASLEMTLAAPTVTLCNCFGTQQVLALARHWQASRFVFLSSLPVIGVPQQHPITENHPVAPATAYHASKLFGEQLVELAAGGKLSVSSLRISAPVGPGMPTGRLLAVFVRRCLNGAPLEIHGRGSRVQNYVDVRDVARAVAACLARDGSGVFNIGGPDSLSNLELAQRCVRHTASRSEIRLGIAADRDDDMVWDPDLDKARQILGFEPEFDIDKSIASLITEYAPGAAQ